MSLTGGVDALMVVQPGQDHGVRIRELDQEALVLETLGRWLEMELTSLAAPGPLTVPARAMLYGTPDDPTLDPVGW